MSAELKQVGSRKILHVMAAEAEYGEHQRKLFSPLFCGVGPVEAAIALTRALTEMRAQNALPDHVISLGSAGSATLEQTAIYQAVSVSYRDMDASPLGFEKGVTPFLGEPATLPLITIADIPAATLSTGANIVSGKAYQSIDADMVDMETYAIARVCMSFDLPLTGLRGISDGRDDLKHITDWTQYLHVIDEKMAKAVQKMEASLSAA